MAVRRHGSPDWTRTTFVLGRDSPFAAIWLEFLANNTSGETFLVTTNWDIVVEQAVEAIAKPDPASELRRILRAHAPDIASASKLLPRTRAEALQIIAILISLMSLWVATHQGDQRLSAQDELRLAHTMGVELRSYAHERPDQHACVAHK